MEPVKRIALKSIPTFRRESCGLTHSAIFGQSHSIDAVAIDPAGFNWAMRRAPCHKAIHRLLSFLDSLLIGIALDEVRDTPQHRSLPVIVEL